MRRRFLACALRSAALLCAGGAAGALAGTPLTPRLRDGLIDRLGPLGEPDANGLRLPAGFTSRVVAMAGREPVPGCGYPWHPYPDGGAVFAAPDGGWIYVSNSEMPCLSIKRDTMARSGGVGALRFDAKGNLRDAYPVLAGRSARNCAGGPTPWNTWLSCEEFRNGIVFECDPFGAQPAKALPALGRFAHEAAAVDPEHGHVYLTEDEADGYLYRFVAQRFPDLSRGHLQAARVVEDGDPPWAVQWVDIPDPGGGALRPLRRQVRATQFHGGEGAWYERGTVYFATKRDDRLWALDTGSGSLRLLFDGQAVTDSEIDDVDNLVGTGTGEILVAEDRGDQQIVVVAADGRSKPLLQVVGQPKSELAGQAFSPDGRRLYFSSQRGPGRGWHGIALPNPLRPERSDCFPVPGSAGVTYEVSGPFLV